MKTTICARQCGFNFSSTDVVYIYGIPNGSVLGPLLYLLCTSPVADIIRQHGMDFNFYADPNLDLLCSSLLFQ